MKFRNGFVSNSSTSSFICQTKISLAEVRKKLVKMVEFYNDLADVEHSFSSIFCDPFIAGDEYTNGSWAEYYPEMTKAKGKIIIEGSNDNSIPWELNDLIESIFGANRCHLG